MESMRSLVDAYVDAASTKNWERLGQLVQPDATFDGTVKPVQGREAFVQGFRNLAPIAIRHDVRDIIVEGNKAFVLYDFVTDTDVGSVLCGEFLTARDGLIASSTLIFDLRRWPEVLQVIARRAK